MDIDLQEVLLKQLLLLVKVLQLEQLKQELEIAQVQQTDLILLVDLALGLLDPLDLRLLKALDPLQLEVEIDQVGVLLGHQGLARGLQAQARDLQDLALEVLDLVEVLQEVEAQEVEDKLYAHIF